MKNILFYFISLLPFSGLMAQYPCPEIISSDISPNSGNFCPGDELTLTWDGINLENAIDCGFGWTFWNAEQPGSINYIQEIPYQINFGACVAPEMLYMMVNPDDTLVGGPDDCHDEFVVLYIGGPRPRDCGGGPIGIAINQIQLCFNYQLIGNYCPGSGWWHNYVPGNTSVFNCGIPLGPNDYIPENSILIIQTSPHGEVNNDLGELCNMGIPVYVIAIDTPAECTGGFIPNSTGECSSCALLYWPGWCLPGGENDYGTVGLDYDLPSMPVSGWGISNSLGGDEFGSVVPDVDVTEFYTGTEVIPLPVTWEIPGDFCLNYGPGTYQIVGGLDSWLYTICPESQITTDTFEVTISCPEVSAGEDITICEGDIAPVEGDVFGGAGSYEWTTNGDGEFGDPSLVETTYSPGPNDISNGQVILSLMFLSCEMVSDDLILTIVDMIQVDAGPDQTICSDVDVDLDAIISGGGGNPMVIWATDGDGIFINGSEPETNYIPGADDIDNGVVHLTLTAIDPFGVCTPVSTTIQITILNAITIAGVPDQVCHYDDPISLPTVQSGYTGNWSGAGVTNNTFNPTGLDGVYALIFVPDQMVCGANATTWITVIAQTPSLNLPAFFCASGSPYDLNSVAYWETMMNIIPGIWSGTGVTNNTFDPSGLNGFVWLTFEPNPIYCLTTVTGQILVVDEINPQIAGVPASLCEDDNPISLPTTQGGVDGNWSGQAVSNNTFDPSGLNGNVTLTFIPHPGQCAGVVTTDIYVESFVPLTISGVPDSLCELNSPVTLLNIQTGVQGNWSGQGVSNNVFNPFGLNGDIVLTFTPDTAQCAEAVTTDITVENATIPVISGIPDSLCQWDVVVDLPTVQNGIAGDWSGPGVLNNTFDPEGQAGLVILIFTPEAGQCASTVSYDITVNVPDTPVLSGVPAILCQNALPFSLPPLQNGISGIWSGEGVSANIFDPSGLSGLIILSFTPEAGQCAAAAVTTIQVSDHFIPVITGIPILLCEESEILPLPEVADGIFGNWSGQGVTNNTFNPSGLGGVIDLLFTPESGQCADVVEIEIIVDEAILPLISDIPEALCQLNEATILPSQIDGITGAWSGPGVMNNTFNPLDLDGQITLTFIPDTGQCALATSITIDVSATVIPEISGLPATLCQSEPVIQLPMMQDGMTGYWTGPGVLNNTLDPKGLEGVILLVFHPLSNACAENAMVEMVVNSTPTFVNLNASCDSITQTYTVSFDIYGGDPLSYTVNGAPVGGSSFVSAPIDADNIYYSFILDDANACGAVAVSGSLNCACATFAGTMNLSNQPMKICEGSGFTVMHLGNDNLDPDDILIYVLHDQAGAQLGTILATSQTPTFSYPPGVTLGQVYYVSAIAGTNNGTGNVDLSEECLSVSQGVPVLFYKPEFALSAGTEICANECVTYTILLTGVQPFVFSYQVLANDTSFNQSLMSDTGSATITLCPAAFGITNGTLDIQPLTLSDANCIITLSPQQTVATTIHGHSLVSISHGICPGEAILVNGITYDQNNLTGTQTLEGANAFGCDSVIEINLWPVEPAVFDITRTLCEGASLVINGNEYNSDRPTGIEVIPGGSLNGCDSIITISLTFDSILVENIIAILCVDESLIVNGTTYDISNPSGSVLIPGGSASGCDSMINIELSFYPLSVLTLDEILCPGDSLIVNGSVYDKDHAAGTEIISQGNIHGCDSIVEVSITYYPEANTSITDTLFSGDGIVVEGVLFDTSNPVGTVVIPGASASGCDSIVKVALHFLSQLSAVIEVVDPVCPGESGAIILEALFGGHFPLTVVLDGMDTLMISALPYVLQNLDGGIHDIWMRDAFAFTFQTQIELQEPATLAVDAGVDQFILEGNNTFLHGTANFEVSSWQWYPPEFLSCTTCADPVVMHPDQPITYTLNVTDLNGCNTSDVVTVFVEEEAKVFIPNAFTPNGDGTNDTWSIYSEDVDARIQKLVIYDRWGGIIFSRNDIAVNDPAAGWDGMVNGSQIHPGVYVFRAELVTGEGKVTPLHGDVTLFW